MSPTTPIVPEYPVVTLELTANGRALHGQKEIPLEDGQSARDAAIALAAREAAAKIDADPQVIRVRVLHDGDVFFMAVTSDQQVFPLDDEDTTAFATARPASRRRHPTSGARSRGRRRLSRGRKLTVIGLSSLLGLVVAGGGTAAGIEIWDRAHPAPVVEPIQAIPGPGARVPLLPPPGFAETATWSRPIARETTPLVLSSGAVVAVLPDGTIRRMDAGTGRISWTGTGAARIGDLAATRLNGKDVIAASSGTALTVWTPPTTATNLTARTRPETVALPPGADVSFDGQQPLIVLPDQTAKIITSQKIAQVDIPAGSEPFATRNETVLSWAAPNTLNTTSATGTNTQTSLTPPAKNAKLVSVTAAGPDNAVATWSVTTTTAAPDTTAVTSTQGTKKALKKKAPTAAKPRTIADRSTVLQLISLENMGTVRATGTAPANALSSAEPIRDTAGPYLTLAGSLVDYSTDPAITPLPDPTATVTAVTGGDIWMQTPEATTALPVADPSAKNPPRTTGKALVPDAISGPIAFVSTHKLSNTVLYALPTKVSTP